MIRQGYLKVNNQDIWYSGYGLDKAGTPLLVVHGGPGFASLPQVICDLADERPVYFYDQLGCGRSARPDGLESYTLDYYVAELAEVRRRLGLEQVYLMAFSWGTALVCAYMLRENPAGVAGLVLSGPLLSTPRWDADQRDNIARLPEAVRRDIEKGESSGDYGGAYQNALQEYYRRHVCLIDPWPDFLQEAMSRFNLAVYNHMWGPSEFTITGSLRSLDLTPELHRIQCPVLLTCGDRDEAGVKTVKDFQSAFADARLAVLPAASHLHHLEQPEIYKHSVRDFLHRDRPGAAAY